MHLLVTGALTGVLFVSPQLIVLGYFLLFLPGVILDATPSVFSYSLFLTGLLHILRPLGKVRWGLAPLVLACAGILIPYAGNLETSKKIQELTNDDIDVANPIRVGRTIALVKSAFGGHLRNDSARCDSLCQRLLYDGLAERVLVGAYQKYDNREFGIYPTFADLPATAYFIKPRDVCPSGPETLSTVSQRVAGGDCLVSEEANLAEAETVYITEQLERPRRYALGDRYNPGVAAVSATRKRIIEKTEDGYTTLYQKTEAKAEPLIYPLLFAGIWHGDSSLNLSLGFLREDVVLNDLRYFRRDEEPRIFGVIPAAVKPPATKAGKDARALVLKALRSEGPEKQAGHDFFKHYLAAFSPRDQDLTPSKEDIDVVILALMDERITAGFRGLWSFNRKLESVPDALVEAMANRILSTPDQRDVVESLAAVIGDLPEGKAAGISGQILEMSQLESLSHFAWKAIARLGDGDPRAAEHYLAALQAWRGKKPPISGQVGFDTPKGPLVGLCRMGEKARGVKDDLLRILKFTNDTRLSQFIIEALLNMGAEADLRREFEQKEERWPQIANAIRLKEQYDTGYYDKHDPDGKVYRGFCRM